MLASAPASALDASSVDDGSRVSAAGTEAPVTEAALASLTCSDGSVAVVDGRESVAVAIQDAWARQQEPSSWLRCDIGRGRGGGAIRGIC